MNLETLVKSLTVEEREALAKKVPTDAGYLWQLATQWRGKKPSLGLLQKLVAADERLTLGELVEEFAGAGEKDAAHSEHPHGRVATRKPRNADRSNTHRER